MNTHIMSNEKIYWFIFYNDQLLIEKKNGKYQIPYTPESPIKREMDIPVLNVPVPGHQAKTFRVTKPISVSEQYEWIGLRSSYDYFKGTFNSLVAGFLETGENLEECVAREVMEETQLKIKNISYFGSQSWPYPSGLMVGFIADYESGKIELQDDELSSGAFYTRDNLPELPHKLSLARKMIDWWLEQNSDETK